MDFIFLQQSYLQVYADTITGKGPPLYNYFDFVDGTITPICRPNK